MLKRKIINELTKWKEEFTNKALLIKARQHTIQGIDR